MVLFWTVVVVLAIVTEMMTGTFYLLVFGIAGACALGIAWQGMGRTWQFAVAALVAIAGAAAVHRWRARPGTGGMPAESVATGEVVGAAAPGRVRIRWRGTEWDGVSEEVLAVGDAVSIVGQQGNLLRVTKQPA